MSIERFMSFKDKTAVITGGTSGIGYEMVRILEPYNKVLVVARAGPRLDALKKEFPSIDVYPADLSKPQEFETLADRIIEDHTHIDVLINNAAVQNTSTFLSEEFSYDSIIPEIHLNFTSVCALSYLLLPALLQDNREAVIANINSGLGLVPKTGSAVYCATKGGMNIFSQSLGYQLEHTNIRVMQAFLPLVEIAHLRPHEHIRPQRVEEMYQKIYTNNYFHKPLLVDRPTMTILDGHHRYNASLRLGLTSVPAIVVDYLEDESISVEAWHPQKRHSVSKQDVLAAAIGSKLMPPKSSRHAISTAMPQLQVPLSKLRSMASKCSEACVRYTA